MNLQKFKEFELLYVEDNIEIIDSYIKTLKLIFKSVETATNYKQAIEKYKNFKPDIMFIDISLYELNGVDIVREIREFDFKTYIVMLTAHTDNKYLIELANLQIDGYIVKPLTIDKLEQILNQILKKIDFQNHIYIDSEYKYDLLSKELFKNDIKISLGAKENRLLELFVKNPKRTLTREEIEYEIWSEPNVGDSAFKSLILSLRKKIGSNKIINVTGIGWKININ